jgi:macrodomain Ter protein organizer (MatP/YcbG family)
MKTGFIIPDERVKQKRHLNAHSASTREKQIIINP